MNDIKQQVRQFIGKTFYVPDPTALGDDLSLLDQGIVDSTGVLEVVHFLEESFEIKVSDEEISPDNLDTIGRIATYVAKKKNLA